MMRKVPIAWATKGILAAFCAVCIIPLTSLAYKTWPDIQKFLQAKGQYALLKDDYTTFWTAREIKCLLPSDATVDLFYQKQSIEPIALQYALYPIKVVKDSPVVIDLDRSLNNIDPGWGKTALSTGMILYDTQGYDLPNSFHSAPHFSQGRSLAIFLLSALFYTVIGFLFFPLKAGGWRQAPCLWLWTMYYLTGVIAFNGLLWLLMFLDFPLNIQTLVMECAMLLLLFPVAYFHKGPLPAMAREDPDKSASFLKLSFLLVFALVLMGNIATPVHDWDSMATWLSKAQVIAHQQNLDLSYTKNNHNYYPLLWPLHIAIQYTLMSGIFDEAAVWSSALALCCFFILLFHGLRLLKVPPQGAWLSLILFTGLFIREYPFYSALPENIFLAVLAGLMTIVLLWLEHPEDQKLKKFIIFLALGLNMIKLEGSFVTVFLIASLMSLKSLHPPHAKIKGLIIGLVGTILFPALWVVWTKLTGLSPGITHLQDPISWNKLSLLVQKGSLHFVKSGELVTFLLFLLTLRGLPNSRRWNSSEKFLLLFTLFLVGFRWVAFAGWSAPMINSAGIFPDACSRLFLHAALPLTLLWASRHFHRAG